MSNFKNFRATIGALRELNESDRLDDLAMSIGEWDTSLNQQAKDQARMKLLEAHTRLAMIDPLFESLGWNLTSRPKVCYFDMPTACIEVPVTPAAERRWMDYLGFEHVGEAQRSRLMIEAKRYSLKLPVIDRHSQPERHPFREKIWQYASGQLVSELTEEWRGYLKDHLQYLRGLESRNGRLAVSAITNGVWWVIISDPHLLLSASTARNAEILCYESLERLDQHAEIVFQKLSRNCLCPGADLISIDDVADVLDPRNVAGVSFATVVTYSESPAPFKQVPRVSIAPLVAIIGTNGSMTFCRCDNDHAYDAPPSIEDRATLEAEQRRLAQRLRSRFDVAWQLLSVAELTKRVVALKIETKRLGSRGREWRFLTGDRAWILEESVAVGCFAHNHQPSEHWHCVELERQPSTDPRTMFRPAHPSQCRHIDLKDKRHRKDTTLTGGRGLSQSPLCWIHELEQYGCCQNCVFLTHCPATQSAQLPCNEKGFVSLDYI